MREAHDVQEPAQNIQYRCPLTEDQRPAAFALRQAVLLSPTALGGTSGVQLLSYTDNIHQTDRQESL